MASAAAERACFKASFPSVIHPLALACALVCATTAVQAQQAQPEPNSAAVKVAQANTAIQIAAAHADRNAPVMRDVVVSASRDEQDADSLPMTVDVIDAKQMEEDQIGDIRELATRLPNV